MKKILLSFYFVFFVLHGGFSQNPLLKEWDKRYGGKRGERFPCIKETNDKGFILSGWTCSSNSGNMSQPLFGYFDYWAIKISKIGNKKWDTRFGGTHDDFLQTMCETSDQGFVFGGYSQSDSSGNKTQATWDYSYDYWIIKTDSVGNKQWDKDFGGNDTEYLYSVKQTNDGGYIIGGESQSDSSGDKSQHNWNYNFFSTDCWIVKIDSLGNKMWDKRFGGTVADATYSIIQTNDGGYVLGGASNSGVSGDKTQPNWDTTNTTVDMWIVKIDSAGNKLWDKCFGGINSDWLLFIIKADDEGYVLGGGSFSDISGDKTQPNWDSTLTTEDYWIVKTDSLFNKIWDKRYGGTSGDYLKSIQQTDDGGLLLAGSSNSGISGDKSENNLGTTQTWIVKTDANGNKLWDKTIFTTGNDYLDNSAIQSSDGCYLTATATLAGIGGYKTQPNWDTIPPISWPDFWIAKFCDSTATTGISNLQIPNTNLQIFPNPTNDFINISFTSAEEKNVSVEIFDFLGREVLKRKFQFSNSNFQTKINISDFENGIYIIQLNTENNLYKKKIVKM